MATFFITSSLMVIIILIARFLLKNKTSFLILYPLWGIVLLRLLIPVTFIESKASIMNLIYALNSKETSYPAKNYTEKLQEETADGNNIASNKTPVSGSQKNLNIKAGNKIKENKNINNNNIISKENKETTIEKLPENQPQIPENNLYNLLIKTAVIIWISGSTIFFSIVIISNTIFYKKLKRTRKHIYTGNRKINVFISEAVNTPCIAGILHPAVYIPIDKYKSCTDCNNTQSKYLKQILEHEYTHIRHKDNIWSLMRTICLGIYWFDPFVHAAAFYSKQDAELACDEAVLKNCTNEEKYNYGKMLLITSQEKNRNNFYIAASITGNKNNLKERITMISNSSKKKLKKYHAVLTVAITVILAGCGMTKEKTAVKTIPAGITDNTAGKAEETKTPVKTAAQTDNNKNSVDNNTEYKIEKIFQDFINNKIKSRPEWSKWKGDTKDLYFSIQYAEDNSPYLLVTTDVISDTNETIDAFVYYYGQEQKNIELLTYLASNGTADPIKIKDGHFVISTHHSLRVYDWAADGDKSVISAEEIYGYFTENENNFTYSLIKWKVPFYNRKIRLDARKIYSKDKIDTYAHDTSTVKKLAPVKAEWFYNNYANANPVPFYSNTEENWNKFYNDGSLRGTIHNIAWHGDDSNSSIIMEIVNGLSSNDFIRSEEESSILINGSRLSYSGKFNDEEVLFFLNKGYTIRAFILRTGPAEYASYDVYTLDTSVWDEKDILRDELSSANSPEIFINLRNSKLARADFDNDGETEIAFYITENPYTLNEYKTLYMFDQESYGDYKTYHLYSYTKDDYRYFAEQVCINFDNATGLDQVQQLKQGNYFRNIKNQPDNNNYKSRKNIIHGDTLSSYNYIISDNSYKNNYEFGSKNNYYITLEDDKTEIKTSIGISYNKKGESQKYNAEFSAILHYKGNGKFVLKPPYIFKNPA